MSLTRTAVTAGALLLLGVATALGQQGHRPGHAMQMGQQSGMMGRIQFFAPANLLEQRDSLGLTADQIAALTSLEQKLSATRESAMAGHDRNRQLLMDALTAAEPDRRKIRGHFDAAHASMGAAHWAEVDAALSARELLTGEQRDYLERRLAPSGRGPQGCC